jgi:hypothetical protein
MIQRDSREVGMMCRNKVIHETYSEKCCLIIWVSSTYINVQFNLQGRLSLLLNTTPGIDFNITISTIAQKR